MLDNIDKNNSLEIKIKTEFDNLQDQDTRDVTNYLNLSKSFDNFKFNGEIGYVKVGKNFNQDDFKEFAGELKYEVPDTNFYTGAQILKYDTSEIFEFNFGRYFSNNKNSYLELSYSEKPSKISNIDYNEEFYNLIYGKKFDLTEYFGKGWVLNTELGPQLYSDEINIRFFLNLENPNYKGFKFSQDLEFFYHINNGSIPREDIYTTFRTEYQLT